MRLTIHTDHALRMLMLLALESEPLHTIEDIARRYNISHRHLMKIARAVCRNTADQEQLLAAAEGIGVG